MIGLFFQNALVDHIGVYTDTNKKLVLQKITKFQLFLFTDRIVVEGTDVTPELHSDLQKLNVLMNITDDVAGKYVNDLLSLEYKWLNDSQKEVFDLIKQMWETNTFIKALFPSQPNRIPKIEHKQGTTNINVMNTEKVKIKSGQKVIMSIE